MRVIVATEASQGEKPGDYCHTLEGELVALPWMDCPEAACGCGRGFRGLSSHRATTTARVVNRPELTPGTYRQILLDDAVSNGFGPVDDELLALIDDEVRWLRHVADELPLGSIIERRRGLTRVRRMGLALHG